jgi:hypothetical protein|uniref:Uncharacterized protein n=1 Tax=viral metagenome TaxID=1070528 RepID=A0A6C0LW50_9ZZZZ
MLDFLKQIFICCGCIETVNENNFNNTDDDKYRYQPEGNRFIYNKDL